MEPDIQQENGSSGDGNSSHNSSKGTTRAAGECGVKPLPALKDNVKRVMFYC
jgi:eukaryotic translation initiation factor 2C